MSALDSLVARGEVETDVALATLTTYKFGGPASWYSSAESTAELALVIDAAVADGVPYLIVGRGSNLVVSDAGFEGLVVKLGGALSEMAIQDDGSVTAGAAMPLPKLARAAAKAGRGGLEFLVAVPGSVGGAVRMNAGCHGSETGEWLLSVQVYRPGVGVMELAREELTMTYRYSSLPTSDVVLSARFRTEPRDPGDSEDIMRDITAWRKEHQPGGTFNAGSVFKNPAETSAGWLIDSLGLKGLAIGGARVSPKHANFFEADPEATAQDLYDLVALVRRRVEAETGVLLEPEIHFAGEFETDHAEMPNEPDGAINNARRKEGRA